MKKRIAYFLAIVLLLGLCGCGQEAVKLHTPVNFYYLRVEPTYGSSDSLIAPVATEGFGYSGREAALLELYLTTAPDSEQYYSPFPADLKLLALDISGSTADIQLDKSFAKLTGMDLTLACACLTLTVLDLTEVETVRITAKNATLDGVAQIIMDRGLSLIHI